MSRLTTKEKKMYTDIFNQVDKNSDGRLSLLEIKHLYNELGFIFDEEQLKELFTQLDTNNSVGVTLEEFLSAMKPLKRKEKRCASYRRMFKKMDKNKDGFLTAEEIHRGLSSASGEEQWDMAEIEQLIAQADVNDDGKLNYEEFLALIKPKLE